MNKLSPQEEKIWFHEGRMDELMASLAVGTQIDLGLEYGPLDGLNTTRVHKAGNSDLFGKRVYAASLNKNLVAVHALDDLDRLSDRERGLLLTMLGDSDNNAFRYLKDLAGAEKVNRFARDTVGVTQTELAIRPDGSSFAGFTTNSEAALVFRYLMNQAAQKGKFGQAVIGALGEPDSHYGTRQRITRGVLIRNKTGTDFTTAHDEEVGEVAVAHDVGYMQPREGHEGNSFLYSVTSASETVKGAKKANQLMGFIGIEMAKLSSDEAEVISGIQALMNRLLRR